MRFDISRRIFFTILFSKYHFKLVKRLTSFFLLLFITSAVIAQSTPNSKRGTIRVRKTGNLVKVQYDNVNYRLIGIDRFGNLLDNAVVAFQMSVSIQGVFYTEKAAGPTLTKKMQQMLSRIDGRTSLFFKRIKAKDNNGSMLNMPDFQYVLGHASYDEFR